MEQIKKRRVSLPPKAFIIQFLAIAIPIALQNLFTTTGSMVDTIMLASLGSTTVGAVGLCAQFSSLLFSCYWGFIGGGMLFFSQYFGAKDDRGVCRSYGLTLCCMMFMGLLFGGLAVIAPEFIMNVYTDKASIQQIGVEYLRIVGFAYPLQVLAMAMSALLRTTERVRIPLVASIASLVVNMGVNWLLIFGMFGLPKMGVRGAAIGTLLSAGVNVALTVILAKKTGHQYLLRFREHFRWTKPLVAEYFKKCFPIICNEFLVGVGNMVINIVLGRQPEEAIAAVAVFRTLEGLIIGFFAGFSNSASVLVGTCVGSGKHGTAYQRAKWLIGLCPCVIFTACLLVFLLSPVLLPVMSLTGEAYDLGRIILFIYMIAATIRMTNWIHNDTFRAAGDPYFGTILEITFMYVVVLPCVCLAGFVFHLPFPLVFLAVYIDEPIRVILMIRHRITGKWIRPVTDAGKAALPEFQKALAAKCVSGEDER